MLFSNVSNFHKAMLYVYNTDKLIFVKVDSMHQSVSIILVFIFNILVPCATNLLILRILLSYTDLNTLFSLS